MWPAAATQTTRPQRATTRVEAIDDRRCGVAQRHRGADLADQPRDQDQVAGVGGEQGVEEAVFERPLEEDRAVLGPERFERVPDPEAGQLQDGAEGQHGDGEQRQLAAPIWRSSAGGAGRGRAGAAAAAPPTWISSAPASAADDIGGPGGSGN